MFSVNKKNNFPIGLDISEYSIKLAQIKKGGNSFKIQALSRQTLEKGLIEGGEIKNTEKVAQKIKEITSKPKFGQINSNDVAICLPDTKSFVKLIEIEKSLNNLPDIISTEIEKHIPMSAKEIFYDWQLVKETPDKYLVLIGAAPQNIVYQYLDVLSQAGLTAVAIEPESAALCRSLLPEENPKYKTATLKNYTLIDIGAHKSSLTIYGHGTIILSISMPVSGEEITEKIAKTLDIKRDQAEKAKIICGLDKTKAQGIIYEMLSDMLSELNSRIKSALEFYANHYPDFSPVNEIIICGGGANIKLIDQYIKDFNQIQTRLGDAFVNLSENQENYSGHFSESHSLSAKVLKDKNDANLALKQDTSLSYAVAIGLALRQIFTS